MHPSRSQTMPCGPQRERGKERCAKREEERDRARGGIRDEGFLQQSPNLSRFSSS